MKFMYKLVQFMNGRYGIDRLFYGLFGLSFALSVSNIFIRSHILQLVVYAIVVLALLRVLSRNTDARSRENRFFTGWIDKIKQSQLTRRSRAADSAHIYKKCPKCKAVLRLPNRAGKHTTVCPKCNNEFKVNVRKHKT